eukprot:CAMPEP_0179077848 /NCGR_PEP_ID=MMETSP0796-20121207/34824_1 /TAXON_ID=73915 /ORGANISM="Pyrodinium bahamense, Strain pbaha01" /LENGTH=851 /DNA_ID=CAMNT_0020775137 /DNA_START=23 /DNA_END=2578 /DNA_ORIENTATION=-
MSDPEPAFLLPLARSQSPRSTPSLPFKSLRLPSAQTSKPGSSNPWFGDARDAPAGSLEGPASSRSSLPDEKPPRLPQAALRSLPSALEEVLEVERLSKAAHSGHFDKDAFIQSLEEQAFRANARLQQVQEEVAQRDAQDAVERLHLRQAFLQEAAELETSQVRLEQAEVSAAEAREQMLLTVQIRSSNESQLELREAQAHEELAARVRLGEELCAAEGEAAEARAAAAEEALAQRAIARHLMQEADARATEAARLRTEVIERGLSWAAERERLLGEIHELQAEVSGQASSIMRLEEALAALSMATREDLHAEGQDLCDELQALHSAAAAVRTAALSKDDIICELEAENAALAHELRQHWSKEQTTICSSEPKDIEPMKDAATTSTQTAEKQAPTPLVIPLPKVIPVPGEHAQELVSKLDTGHQGDGPTHVLSVTTAASGSSPDITPNRSIASIQESSLLEGAGSKCQVTGELRGALVSMTALEAKVHPDTSLVSAATVSGSSPDRAARIGTVERTASVAEWNDLDSPERWTAPSEDERQPRLDSRCLSAWSQIAATSDPDAIRTSSPGMCTAGQATLAGQESQQNSVMGQLKEEILALRRLFHARREEAGAVEARIQEDTVRAAMTAAAATAVLMNERFALGGSAAVPSAGAPRAPARAPPSPRTRVRVLARRHGAPDDQPVRTVGGSINRPAHDRPAGTMRAAPLTTPREDASICSRRMTQSLSPARSQPQPPPLAARPSLVGRMFMDGFDGQARHAPPLQLATQASQQDLLPSSSLGRMTAIQETAPSSPSHLQRPQASSTTLASVAAPVPPHPTLRLGLAGVGSAGVSGSSGLRQGSHPKPTIRETTR